ncbi:MAG: hypothetical protein ACYSVY_22295 [Planctomycetota bacterium]
MSKSEITRTAEKLARQIREVQQRNGELTTTEAAVLQVAILRLKTFDQFRDLRG